MTTDERVHVSHKQLIKLQHQARGFSFLPKQPVGSRLMGRNRSNVRGRGLDFVELRDYRLGDDIRSMDWRVTNRTGKPHVRVYAEEKDHPVLLVVDQRSSMFFGSRWKMKSVIAAELAAIIAWRTLAVGDRAGFVLITDNEIIEFKPTRNKIKLQQYLATLAKVNQALSLSIPHNTISYNKHKKGKQDKLAQTTSLAEVAKKLGSLMSHDYLAIIISDFIDFTSTFTRNLNRAARHNDFIAAHVIDDAEKDLTNIDQVIVGDGHYQLKIDVNDGDLKQKYAMQLANAQDELHHNLRKHKISLLEINTHESVESQLFNVLGKNEVRGKT